MEGGGCSLCPNFNPAKQKAFKTELEALAQNKRSSLSADAASPFPPSSPKAPNTGIMTAFGKTGRKEADQAILNWLASSSLPPYAVSGFIWRKLSRR
jgi:hypothetical protein